MEAVFVYGAMWLCIPVAYSLILAVAGRARPFVLWLLWAIAGAAIWLLVRAVVGPPDANHADQLLARNLAISFTLATGVATWLVIRRQRTHPKTTFLRRFATVIPTVVLITLGYLIVSGGCT